MPQAFAAVRCCSCATYHVQQSKQSLKWKCSLCGELQTVAKVVAIPVVFSFFLFDSKSMTSSFLFPSLSNLCSNNNKIKNRST